MIWRFNCVAKAYVVLFWSKCDWCEGQQYGVVHGCHKGKRGKALKNKGKSYMKWVRTTLTCFCIFFICFSDNIWKINCVVLLKINLGHSLLSLYTCFVTFIFIGIHFSIHLWHKHKFCYSLMEWPFCWGILVVFCCLYLKSNVDLLCSVFIHMCLFRSNVDKQWHS